MSTQSIWDAYSLGSKIVELLRDLSYAGHHLGRPFLTGYQIAILFKEKFPEDFERLGYPVGGEGSGVNFTLSSYLARELSQRIKSGEVAHVDGGFLSNKRLRRVEFTDAGKVIVSSLTGGQEDVAIFRYKDEPTR